MPFTEFKFMSRMVKKQKEDERYRAKYEQIRCPFCEDVILKNDSLQSHILYNHHHVYVHACHFCFEGFISLELLKKHGCQDFSKYTVELETQNLKLQMKYAMHTMICAECNLQIPLRMTRSSAYKRHIRLQRLLVGFNEFFFHSYHNSEKLVSCITLFAVQPSGVEYVKIKSCSMKYEIPIKCEFCSHKFISALDIENHQLIKHSDRVHKLQCPLCPVFYVTDIFFRDHLLSHFEDMHSMVSLLERTTFCSPLFFDNTTFRMGPVLQNAIGCNITELSRVDELDDVNINLNDSKPSTLCYCTKSESNSNSFVEEKSLIKSLVEKFTVEGHLYVDKQDSILDTAVGAVIDDSLKFSFFSVFLCVRCKGLHVGKDDILKHLRNCLQKDVESLNAEKHFDLTDDEIVICIFVIRLSPLHCSPNNRISCPECTDTCCSIYSLRRHLALQHGTLVHYNTPGQFHLQF
ncbi:unnamed protein product [Thelazia callipaeda]|uniref:C2H2-type domain-containing protein n=1 Tax=Thelazia callipaeda TaxID=103827 RepID=A0A0N5DC68_THECL|nr:unnamed protein product [Thelazia callipaeda]